jgi:hypothetical protein
MRSGVSFILIGVVLCACVTATEQPAQFSRGDILIASSGDPNEGVPPAGSDPNKTWDPAAHLAADWESVSVSIASSIYNPAVQPDIAARSPQWSLSTLSVWGVIDIIDSNGLIGWAITPSSAKAFDQDGQLIASNIADSPMVRSYRPPTSWSVPANFPSTMRLNRVVLSLPVESNVDYPDGLSRVEWTTNVLVADEITTVDVPFKAKDAWVELAPGVEILVEQAIAEEGKYQYRIKVRYDRTQVDYLSGWGVSLWRDQSLPPAAVLEMEILNAEGQPVAGGSGGSFRGSSSYSESNNQVTGASTGSGTCATCGDAAIIRYTLAFNLYELEASFVLTDVPVPAF